jgi:hypothetical protein
MMYPQHMQPLITQQSIVTCRRELITRFEQKIQATLARVWGEAPEEEGLAQSRKAAKF